MGREATSTRGTRQPTLILVGERGWKSGAFVPAVDRRTRRLGLTPSPGPRGLLIRTRSIHSFGMRAPIGWVAFDDRGCVLAAGIIRPNRILLVRGARFILEQALHLGLPLPGEMSVVRRSQSSRVHWPDA